MKQPKRIVRTIRQMMMNPASGVPLAHNARGLQHFFSPSGFDQSSGRWFDQRGNIVIDRPTAASNLQFTAELQPDGSLYYSDAGTPYAIGTTRGTAMKLAAGDDAMILMVAKHTPLGDAAESPTATTRLGLPNMDQANIRVRMYPIAVGDHVEDDAGNIVDSSQANLQRRYHSGIVTPDVLPLVDDPNTYIMAAALDRTNDLWHVLGLRANTMEVLQDVSQDVSSIGAINLQTNEEANDFTTSGATINGIIFGIGWWRFANGSLPADWKIAVMSMGEAWANNAHTFWPAWGTT